MGLHEKEGIRILSEAGLVATETLEKAVKEAVAQEI